MKTVNNSKPLTPGQKKVLDFINYFLMGKGYPPSLSETAKHFRKSVGTAQHFIRELRAKGYLSNEQNVSRGIKPKSSETKEIFLLGYIAAGEPIEPIENPEPIVIPANMVQFPGNYYALRVKGDSMIDDGILNSDIVLIKHEKTAKIGETVVAVVDGLVTLKTFGGIRKGKAELIPKNSNLAPFYIDADKFEVRGKFMGLIRPAFSLK